MRILTYFLTCFSVLGADYYISPIGTIGGTGAIDSPWSLSKITTGAAVPPITAGDNIWIRGGIYDLPDAVSDIRLTGTALAPIRIRAVLGEMPIFRSPVGQNASSGGIYLSGDYTTLEGVKFLFRGLLTSDIPGSNPPTSVPAAFAMYSASRRPTGNKAINNLVLSWDGFVDGIASAQDINSEFEGNLTLFLGGISPDRPHGGACYVQNDVSGVQKIKGNIFIAGIGDYNCRARSQSVGRAENVWFEDNIFIDSVDAVSYVTQTVTPNNYKWDRNLWRAGNTAYLGQSNGNINGWSISNNDIIQRANFTIWRANATTIANNRISPTASAVPVTYRDQVSPTYTANRYWGSTGICLNNQTATTPVYARTTDGTFASVWQAAGNDVTGNCTATLPVDNWIKVLCNTYEPGRANLGVYNFSGLTSESFDISACGMPLNAEYEVISGYSPDTIVASGVYTGSSITVPLTSTAIWKPEPAQLPVKCWQTSCSLCYTDPDWKAGTTVASFGVGDYINQPAIVTDAGGGLVKDRIYYWNGTSWISSGSECIGVPQADPVRDPNMFAFIVRRKQLAKEVIWQFNARPITGVASIRVTWGYSPTMLDQAVMLGAGGGPITITSPPQLVGPLYAQWFYLNGVGAEITRSVVQKITIR